VHASRITDVYENGVEEFLQFAQRNATLVNENIIALVLIV